MKNNKSPGSDGFTTEFYKFFWIDIGSLMVRSINHAYDSGQLSIMQRQGIITSIPKENRDRSYLKNWRPISLLNVDYKIASKAIAERIKYFIKKLISDTQKGFIKGRYIGECTRIMYDLILATEANDIPGMIVLIDFEKAFDSIDTNFLIETLQFYGFGPSICQWVRTFYSNITSAVVNNGHISKSFEINRGVRQGDPLSPYLFILVAEILSSAIKWNPEIKGIKVDDSEFLISQYADDTSLFLDGSEESLREALETLDKFGKCSGLTANVEKTSAIWIGNKKKSIETFTDVNIKWNREGIFKCLGIKYNINLQNFTEGNFEEYLVRVKKLLNNWAYRNITILGKIVVFKSLALSKFVHLFMTLPDPSPMFFKELELLMFKFLWGKGRDRVKRQIIINTIENGGLKVPDVKSFAKALKFIWIKKLVDREDHSLWKVLLMKTLVKKGGNLLWSYDPKVKNEILTGFNPFWQGIISNWYEIQEPLSPDPSSSDIVKQTLWYNSEVLINRKTVFYEDWFRCGIWHVNDLLGEHGGLLSFNEFQKLYATNTNFLQYQGIISAIPRKWKTLLRNVKPEESVEHSMLKIIKGLAKPCRFVYMSYINKIAVQPTKMQERWEREVPEVKNIEWSDIYLLTKQTTKNVKLQVFQYQILQNYLVTNSKLVYYKLKESNLCTFCSASKENVNHLFWECSKVSTLYDQCTEWLSSTGFPRISLTKVNVLLGIFPVKENIIQNQIILYMKRYVYITRCKNKDMNVIGLKEFIKHNIQVEKEMNPAQWYLKWGQIGKNICMNT